MRKSRATRRNNKLGDWSKWAARRSNSTFFQQALKAMNRYDLGNQGLMTIGLVGSRDLPGVTLRQAQSILRWDRKPSLWSHAFLLAKAWNGRTRVDSIPILEIPLAGRTAEFPRPENNGVSSGSKLGLYADPSLDANVALISVARREFTKGRCTKRTHLSKTEVSAIAGRAKDYNFDRLRYDFWESLSAWQRYLWSSGEGHNPLRAGVPVPASSYVEMAFEAIDFDMVPAASERNSAPEHIWNAAVWWHQESGIDNRDTESLFEMRGCFAVRDTGCSIID